jgi:23S rRNA (adenine2503-C2)-methyltransferase
VADARPELPGLEPAAAREELGRFLASRGQPAYRARQVLDWVWRRSAPSFAEMSDLPRELRGELAEVFTLHPLECSTALESVDGTRKFLWQRTEAGAIESVMIPDGERVTYCVSTQAGCPVACTFCATGHGGFDGQLRVAEIVDQVLEMRRLCGKPPTNIVFMGMGEPLLNFPQLVGALRALLDPERLGMGARRITVSTVGVPDRIRTLGSEFPQVKLALSLHAPDERLRNEIIPLNRRFPLREVLDAVRDHCDSTGRQATFEYVVLPDVNDSREQARAVCRRLAEIPSRINLIGFNPFRGAPYERPTVRRLERFRHWLEEGFRGPVTIRRSRGDDIDGACGQLSARSRS